MWRALCVVLLLGLVSQPEGAHAQAPDASMDAEAHALFEAGRTAFAAGRYPDALGDFQRAFDLSHRPELLYNIGQCQDRLRHDAEALAAFEQFLAEVRESPQRAEVESRVAFLRESVARSTTTTTTTTDAAPPAPVEATTPEATPPPPAAAPPPDEGPGIGPWILLGAGSAVALVGIVLVGVGMSDLSSVSNPADGTSYASVRDADHQAPILTGVGWPLIGVGAAAVVGALVWGAIGGNGSRREVALRIAPGMLTLSGTF